MALADIFDCDVAQVGKYVFCEHAADFLAAIFAADQFHGGPSLEEVCYRNTGLESNGFHDSGLRLGYGFCLPGFFRKPVDPFLPWITNCRACSRASRTSFSDLDGQVPHVKSPNFSSSRYRQRNRTAMPDRFDLTTPYIECSSVNRLPMSATVRLSSSLTVSFAIFVTPVKVPNKVPNRIAGLCWIIVDGVGL